MSLSKLAGRIVETEQEAYRDYRKSGCLLKAIIAGTLIAGAVALYQNINSHSDDLDQTSERILEYGELEERSYSD